MEVLSPALILIDQAVGRSVMCRDLFIVIQFRKDTFGQLLAQFYTPLVKTKDVPDDALNKDLMFVDRNETTQTERRYVRR
jgi:hypothetical protein